MACNHLPTPISLTPQQRRGLLNKPEKFSSYPSSSPGHVKEGPTLPPLSVPELNKALKRPQPQWMRLIVCLT